MVQCWRKPFGEEDPDHTEVYAVMEFDPQFLRMLRLLNSKAKDSEEQMRLILEESIRQRYGPSKVININTKKVSDGERSRHEFLKMSGMGPSSLSLPQSGAIGAGAEAGGDEGESSPNEDGYEYEEGEDEDDYDDDDDELALEILEDDLACTVCRGLNVSANNQLVECCGCHSLYHQECHQKPIGCAVLIDPRLAWYCMDCTDMDDSETSVSPRKPASDSSAEDWGKNHPKTEHIAITNLLKGLAASQTSPPAVTHPPKLSHNMSNNGRTNVSSSYGQGSQSKSSNSSVSTSNNKGTSTPSVNNTKAAVVPKINIISADKRLAIMKKKAAKLKEKRKHTREFSGWK